MFKCQRQGRKSVEMDGFKKKPCRSEGLRGFFDANTVFLISTSKYFLVEENLALVRLKWLTDQVQKKFRIESRIPLVSAHQKRMQWRE